MTYILQPPSGGRQPGRGGRIGGPDRRRPEERMGPGPGVGIMGPRPPVEIGTKRLTRPVLRRPGERMGRGGRIGGPDRRMPGERLGPGPGPEGWRMGPIQPGGRQSSGVPLTVGTRVGRVPDVRPGGPGAGRKGRLDRPSRRPIHDGPRRMPRPRRVGTGRGVIGMPFNDQIPEGFVGLFGRSNAPSIWNAGTSEELGITPDRTHHTVTVSSDPETGLSSAARIPVGYNSLQEYNRSKGPIQPTTPGRNTPTALARSGGKAPKISNRVDNYLNQLGS